MNELDRAAHGYEAGNGFLDALPAAERTALRDELTVVELDAPESIFPLGGAIEHVYFPIDALFSITADLRREHSAEVYEVGIIGREGIVGAEVTMGVAASRRFVLTQVAGRAARLPAASLVRRARASAALREAIHRYVLLRIYVAEQLVGCNVAHTLGQRCARWMLMTADRVGSAEFGLRREFLAMMLAIHPSAVESALAGLLATGTIRYEDEVVTIVRPRRLLRASCECYAAMRAAQRGSDSAKAALQER